jgi:hypothetical protein
MIDNIVDTEKPHSIAQAIVWHLTNGSTTIQSTGPTIYCMGDTGNPFLNSESFIYKSAFNNRKDQTTPNSDRDFIRFENQFLAQYKRLSEYYTDLSFESYKQKFSLSLSEILKLKPDVITMELTSEQSVYYTLIKGSLALFIHHYLNVEDLDDDEVIITAFNGDSKLPSFAGSLYGALNELKKIIYPSSEIKSWSPSYELSY